MSKCLLCNASAVASEQENASRIIYNCPVCGVFVVSDLVADNAKLHSNEISAFLVNRKTGGCKDTVLISYDNAKIDKDYIQMTVDQIVGRFPRSFSEKMDYILLNLSLLSPYGGYEFKVEGIDVFPLFYLKHNSFDALSFVIKSMQKADMIEVNYYGSSFFPCGVVISPKGLDRIASLDSGDAALDVGFIVFPRSEETWSVTMHLAARKAIEDCGFKAVESFSINPTNMVGFPLIAQIKRSKFVVCDFSSGSGESYYAAGLAQALGKTAILTCFESEKSKLKINSEHLGVLMWHDKKDLYANINNTIRALVL